MNNKYLYILTIISLMAFVSCEDLDTAPEGDVVTKDQKEEVVKNDPTKAIAGVNAIFAQFNAYLPNETALGAERHNDYGYPSVMLFTDHNGYDLVSEDVGYNWNGNNLSFDDRDITSNEAQILWNDMYAIISTSNNVIGSITDDTEDPDLKFYKAQGLAARAFSYWVLAQLYQFTYVGHESDLCVPIITNENSNSAALDGAPRASVSEVYNLIMSDINTAVDNLDFAEEQGVVRADKRYISAAVAYGLRARINITMQKWADAASDASKAIELSEATPASIDDVSKPTFSDVTENNWMWGIVIAETDDVVESGIINWISHMGSLNWGYANYSGGKQINKSLYESIPNSDVRKGWWVDEDIYSPILTDDQAGFMLATYPEKPYTQVKFAPYNDEVETSTNANDVPLMRIEEMYLIKAEAEAMSGSDGKTTLEDFVQTYRDPSYVCENNDVQAEVFHQRRIELWGEGLNWFDVMRLETGVDRRGGGFPNASMVFNIEPTDGILLWRIPEAEIEANVALTSEDNNPSAPIPDPVADFN